MTIPNTTSEGEKDRAAALAADRAAQTLERARSANTPVGSGAHLDCVRDALTDSPDADQNFPNAPHRIVASPPGSSAFVPKATGDVPPTVDLGVPSAYRKQG